MHVVTGNDRPDAGRSHATWRSTTAAALAGLTLLLATQAAVAAESDGLARWPMDEGTGQVAADVSGHGHHARLGALGGQLFATGGTVDIVVQPGTAAFTSRLFLLGPDGTPNNIALNTGVGKHVTVGPFPAGKELVFGITVLNGGPTYFMGPASRNPDGIAHAEVTETGVRTFLVGFEDHFGGGDRDYDDNVFQFTGNLTPTRPPRADDQTPTIPKPTPNAKSDVRSLRIREARRRLPRVLRKQYGRRFTRRRGSLRRSCYRLSTEKVRCRVRWNTRRHRYSGNATMWKAPDDPDSILITTSIRRTRRATAAFRAR
jgi:hypothetical protein